MKKQINILLYAALIAVAGFQSCKKSDNEQNNVSHMSHNEDEASLNLINDAILKMGLYNDSLAHTQDNHHQLHYDSLFHHHDSLFWHHHHTYHHGDTTHHHSNHGHHQGQHHHIDSIHSAHGPHHP